MSLPLKQSPAVRELAEVLYGFLPGSGRATWKGHVSFKSIADKVGVGDYWQPGSKLPMLVVLLEQTLEFRRDRFEPLVLEIVRGGLTYRQKRGNPIKPEEIDRINGLILGVGFKFPDLWDPGFHAALSADSTARANRLVEEAILQDRLRATERSQRSQELEELKREFVDLYGSADRQKAGLQLEKVLNRLFALHGLDPREAFRVLGEQIDGSFELDHEIYLFEAKWHKHPTPAADLFVFREKILGKSPFTRGVFLSVSGVSREAQEAIREGKQPTFFTIDGFDVMMLLQGSIDLVSFLRRRQRLLAEEGRVSVPFGEVTDQ